jgi:hypothetical protein
MRSPTRREVAFLVLAAMAIIAAVGAERNGSDAAVPVIEAARASRVVTAARHRVLTDNLDMTRPRSEPTAGEPGTIFLSASWRLPRSSQPIPQAKPILAPTPAAPPLPFTYIGRYEDQARPLIFLLWGDRLLLVRAGDVIDGTYRVDAISESVLNVTFLPLQIRQILDIGIAG